MADEPTTPPSATPPGTPPAAAPPAAAPAAPTTDPAAADPAKPPVEEPLGEAGLKALQAERDANKELQRQLQEFKDRDKTEAQKAADRAAEAEARAVASEQKIARLSAIADTGLPAELHEFLPESGDQAALTEKARKLMATLATKQAADNAPRTPQPDPSQGPQGSPTSLEEQIAAAQEAGNTALAIALKARQTVAAKH